MSAKPVALIDLDAKLGETQRRKIEAAARMIWQRLSRGEWLARRAYKPDRAKPFS